jgi:hypothetical protein
MEDNMKCPNCGGNMIDYSKPQRPIFICEDCNGDESGIEVEWCEYCGEPIGFGYDCDCEDEFEDEDD